MDTSLDSDTPLIFNIQRYSIHDGEGIRTTVFFKGCPLRCVWCHNPESQSFSKEIMYYADRCCGCGACVAVCPQTAIAFVADAGEDTVSKNTIVITDRGRCEACGACVNACTHNARELAGQSRSPADLIRELERDRMFYERSGGGITLSGGEVLAQSIDYIEELARRLYQKGYSVDIDTSGYAPYEKLKRLIPYTDAFLYDIKLLDPVAHKHYIGVDNALILNNLERLSSDGAKINLRVLLIGGINATTAYVKDVIRWLIGHHISAYRVNLLTYHDAGSNKYKKLERSYEGASLTKPDEAWVAKVAELFVHAGFENTHIGG